MTEKDPFEQLRTLEPPDSGVEAKRRALIAAMAQFDDMKKTRAATQGMGWGWRLITGGLQTWRDAMTPKMNSRSLAGPAFATLLLVPVVGYLSWNLVATNQPTETQTGRSEEYSGDLPEGIVGDAAKQKATGEFTDNLELRRLAPEAKSDAADLLAQAAPAAPPVPLSVESLAAPSGSPSNTRAIRSFAQKPTVFIPRQPDPTVDLEEGRDRVAKFNSNPVKRVSEEPVSTFSIDTDTASYSMVRRALREGRLPDADGVRVEEMINYFPYSWAAPQSADEPFRATVTVMPTPWNADTRLMHVAIKGYEIAQPEKPKTNLVFLVDTSGSMQDGDKLPLVKASLRLLLDRLGPDDSVGIVSYAGEAGVVLEPTKALDKRKILDAIEKLGAGGSTAGAAGIEEAYRLAESSFIDGGVNRVMLATDGDFNVGPSDDEALKRLVEAKRKSGVFLSILGFGQGNYNDQLMQVIAQNGNGTAAYIDTLAEAEKTLVQEAASALFPIAKDVKIQVEFNPAVVAEYRLIGYETRALNREDFNNDKVDAGEIGSGHSVTAIYELTPVGSPALIVDALRYGKKEPVTQPSAGGEYGYVKIRHKAPDGNESKLVSQQVDANNVVELNAASQDVRFSVAVAAFGQKLRQDDRLGNFTYEAIGELATRAKGEDAFGYRAEFLTLVRLAKGLGE